MAFFLHVLYKLKKIDPQIVHIQDPTIGQYGVLAKWIWGKPYVVICHGYAFRDLRQHTARTVLRHAHTVIALSEDMKKELQRVSPREVLIIPNGVDIEPFNKISRKGARHELGIGEAEKIIIFVGTLHPRKGVRYLIESLECVRQTEPSARLMLVGDGPERATLELLAKDLGMSECVTFIGPVPNDSIPPYLVVSDVFVLPTLAEGLPIVCLEAMAAALPIVATRVGGIPSMVEDGVNGFLVDPQNAGQIADKVSQVLRDPVLRRRLTENNQRKVQQYTWENVVSELEKVYLHR
jgi:glycosyltransferase involved in cell wall biosynthesis